MTCVHEPGGRDWVKMWNGVTKSHPYCGNCGTVKNVSSDRGKKMGFFVAALSRIRKTLKGQGYRVSEAQIRLITKELEEMDGFSDLWWITFSKQKEIFIQVVQKYIKVSRDTIESALTSEDSKS